MPSAVSGVARRLTNIRRTFTKAPSSRRSRIAMRPRISPFFVHRIPKSAAVLGLLPSAGTACWASNKSAGQLASRLVDDQWRSMGHTINGVRHHDMSNYHRIDRV